MFPVADRGIVLNLRIVDRAALRQVTCYAESKVCALQSYTGRTLVNGGSQASGESSPLKTETRAGEAIPHLVQKRPAKGVCPIQRNLLITRRDVYPIPRSKSPGGCRLDILLENIARTDAILASDLYVDSARELSVIEQRGNITGDRGELN